MTITHRLEVGPVFLRRDAVAAEIDDSVLRRGVRDRSLVRVRQGVYADAQWWHQATKEARHVALAHAAHRLFTTPIVFSHWTAALIYGMPVWGVDLRKLHVTHLAPASGRTQAGIVHHRGDLAGQGSAVVDGLPVTGPARTVVDSAKLANVERGWVVADGALAKELVTPLQLDEQAMLQDHDPKSLHIRMVVRGADGGAQSAGESRSRYLFWQAGLPCPVLQYEVRDAHGTLLGIADFAWPEHRLIVEFDGLSKYSSLLRPGETPTDAVIREKLREDRIREAGWTVIRLVWSDLDHPTRTAERIRRAMALRPSK